MVPIKFIKPEALNSFDDLYIDLSRRPLNLDGPE